MLKRLGTLAAITSLFVLTLAGSALAAVNTDATALVTSTVGDVEDTVMATIPIVLAAVLAVGLALWGIRYVLRKFGVRTSG